MLTWIDLGLVFVGIIATAGLISLIQRGPVEGSLGIMDLIVGSPDPRDRVMSVSFSFIVPVVVGAAVSSFAANKVGAAAMSTGIGALISVSVAFIRPDILSPVIRNKLRAAQITYGSFVVGYAALGAASAVVTNGLVKYYQQGDIVNNVAAGLFYTAGTFLVTKVISWLSSLGLKSLSPDNHERGIGMSENIGPLIRDAVKQALKEAALELSPGLMTQPATMKEGTSVVPEELKQIIREIVREELTSFGLAREDTAATVETQAAQQLDAATIRQIVREEMRYGTAAQDLQAAEAPRRVTVQNTEDAPEPGVSGQRWWQPRDSSQKGYYYSWWKPSRPGATGYYFRLRFNRPGFFS